MIETGKSADIRKAIDVTGIVQGVGFRPYVYRLAKDCGLAGFIANTPAGVTIEVQGSPGVVTSFVERLPLEAPPLARITSIASRAVDVNGEQTFRIVTSQMDRPPRALVSPDVAICADCLRELFDLHDRRCRYPFINCTNCGPRFTILRDIPYDRARTSMAVFPMCLACQAEYEDPANRRFHAQPNACWECGPQVELWDAAGRSVEASEPIRAAAALLEKGSIVAVKGLGGFHLACDAKNGAAVERLRERKRRVEKPFAIMAPRLETIEAFCELDAATRELLTSIERPIVLLPCKQGSAIAEEVAPGNRYLGVFLPYTPLHHLLFAEAKYEALVMTSGNLSEEPIAIDNREAASRLAGIADAFLVHNRDILRRCDDSVARVSAGRRQLLRRSRGFVPVPVALDQESPAVLAVGGELKNTICIVRGAEAFLSQHVGDLENLESCAFFEEAAGHLQRILEVRPGIVAYDLHPDYFSTRWALAQTGVKLIGIQHHHAHIASCMAENHLQGRVIGIALDGTGYGTDGAVWGGEVLLAGYEDFERAAHFAYVPMPGGAAAIREPWRMALGYLAQYFGKDLEKMDLPHLLEVDSNKVEVALRMIERGVNSPLTSSCGRLFDAVAALLGLRATVNYEAQAAIELEMAALDSSDGQAYPFDVIPDGNGWRIDTRVLFEALLEDRKKGVWLGDMSRRFHNGLVQVFSRLARLLRKKTSLNRVCLSGGCFQNACLFESLSAALRADGFGVFAHAEVPAGDGGLSLGQALIAAHRSKVPAERR
jgi:hydrogenase maturation protein HypF